MYSCMVLFQFYWMVQEDAILLSESFPLLVLLINSTSTSMTATISRWTKNNEQWFMHNPLNMRQAVSFLNKYWFLKNILATTCLAASLTIPTYCFGQNQKDTTLLKPVEKPLNVVQGDTIPYKNVTKEHSPGKAALLAVAFPGAGQIYNKKWWKLPFVYGGATIFYLTITFNHNNYILFRNNLVRAVNGEEVDDRFKRYQDPENGLRRGRDFYRRNRDFNIILATIFYGITIVDATVDAHLMNFDVSDDLSLNIEPTIMPVQGQFISGLSLQFRFKNKKKINRFSY